MPKLARPRPQGWKVPPLEEPAPDDLVVTHSEIEAYRQCPLKWHLAYNQRWTKTDRPDDHPLTKGTLWHDVMELDGLMKQWRDSGKSTEDHQYERWDQQLTDLLWPTGGKPQSELQELVTWMYEGYKEKYGDDPDWEYLAIEQKFQTRLLLPDGTPSRVMVKGKLDGVWRHRPTQKIWLVDHKSGKELPNELELDLADQFTVYAGLLRAAGIPIIGVVHNGARTTRNQGDRPENWGEDGMPIKKSMAKQTLEQRFRRTLLNRSDVEIDSAYRDFRSVVQNAYPEWFDLDPLPLYSSPDPRQCGWKCDFLEVHLAARKGRPLAELLPEFGFEQVFEERY